MNANDKSAQPAGRKKQNGLLALAIVLLGVMVWINLQRMQGDAIAQPIPLPDQPTVSKPLLEPFVPHSGEPGFAKLDVATTGVDATHPIVDGHPREYLYYSGMAAGGTAVGDLNNDGRLDLFVASGPNSNRLFLQTDIPFKFEDVTKSSGVATTDIWSCGVTLVDINGDGRLDIYVANYDSPNQLYINRGNGLFREEAYKYGLNMTDASLEGVFADFDRDGDLDMYLLTYRYENPAGMPQQPPLVDRNGKKEVREAFKKYYDIVDDDVGYGVIGRSDGLLVNNGDGTFTIQDEKSGIVGRGHGHSAMWWDFDNDGFQDLFVGNDFNDPDRLYRGGLQFIDVSQRTIPHTTWFSMGCDSGDVNNDGMLDLLTTDMSSTTHFKQKTTMGSMGRNIELLTKAVPRQYMRNALLLGGPGRFREAAYMTGMDSTDWTWSAQLIDLDCDGRLDAFFTNGSVRSFTDSDRVLKLSERKGRTEWDIYKDTPPLREENLAFRNLGDLRFEDVSKIWGLNHLGVSMSTAHGDFDGDGDLDLVVANIDEPLSIYRNDIRGNNRIVLDLRCRGQNRFAIGARVTLKGSQGEQIRELQPSRGFIASNEPAVFFGCGADTKVDVDIQWPDGTRESRLGLATGMRHMIMQSESLPTNGDLTAESRRDLFETIPVESGGDDENRHVEAEFDDYAIQPLLPHRMSRLGPCLAAFDWKANGTLDYYLGGAKGSRGVLKGECDSMLQSAGSAPGSSLPIDSLNHEDMAALWIDIDNDGRTELLVASGGNESGPEATSYPLRVYALDANGKLVRDDSSKFIGQVFTSAGGMAAADFDKDGDVDVFVCGRQSPGKYPLPGKSLLLVNGDGRLTDRTAELAPGIAELGMATGALWTDVDNDSDLDLLVTGEWEAIRLFRNDAGKLTDETVSSGLNSFRGWWTGVSAGDFDNDGDMDYVATNMGLNTKYHASDDHPYQIFFGDFDGSGERKLVEAEYEKETLFPVRGKSCSTHAMPFLAEKFSTYKDFAAASLEEIYTPECLSDSYKVSANWLPTSLLINDGEGRFTVKSLPNDAQISPGFGTVVSDLTGNGNLDIFIAQNFHSPQPETGNMDGGLGCLLEGDGAGKFVAVNPVDSGIVIPDDAMAATLTDDGMVVSVNNGSIRRLRRKSQVLKVRFADVESTTEIAGVRITARRGTTVQSLEVSAGNGYLTQQPPFLYFGSSASNEDWEIEATWLNGKSATFPIEADAKEFVIPPSE